MRGFAFARRAGRARIAVCALTCAAAFFAPPLPSRHLAAEGLEPAFRLPVGGKPLAPPLVDARLAPPAAWLLSEDRSLYALGENGALLAKIPLAARPLPLLGLDPFGRALVAFELPASASGRAQLIAYTRSGREAYRAALPEPPRFPPVFGADGRSFVVAGRHLVVLSPQGLLLSRLELPAEAQCAPAVDGAGRAALGLADGSVLVASPYGELVYRAPIGAQVVCLSAFGEASYRELSRAQEASRAGMPLLAAGLEDGRVLLIGATARDLVSVAPPGGSGDAVVSLASDGAVLYGLTAGGSAFALAGAGTRLWKTDTALVRGRIELYAERLVATGRGGAVSLSRAGELFREARIANAAAGGAVSPGGLLFSPGEDWVLAAYRFERPLGPPRRTAPPPYGADETSLELARLYDPAIGDADRQLALLSGYERLLDEGMLGAEEPKAAALAAAMLRGALLADLPQAERRFRGNPLPRARAAWFLGRLGSPEGRGPLIEALEADEDPAVRAAACEALAEIALDPDGAVGEAFLRTVRGKSGAGPGSGPLDERAALALIAAVERMALRSGAPPSADAVRALLSLAAKPYGAELRSRASRALGRIAGSVAP